MKERGQIDHPGGQCLKMRSSSLESPTDNIIELKSMSNNIDLFFLIAIHFYTYNIERIGLKTADIINFKTLIMKQVL